MWSLCAKSQLSGFKTVQGDGGDEQTDCGSRMDVHLLPCFDARIKKNGALDRGSLPTIWLTSFLNFCKRAEILIFAIFSLIFAARKKIISALDRVKSLSIFSVFIRFLKFCPGAEIFMV